jgi:tetratricopeptide (TPR) repeat protein
MPEQENWAIQTRSIIKECFGQIRFARAAELARSRQYLEATMVLSPNGRLPIEPRELDLLARIAAQQKQFDQAARLWEVALQRSPDNETYKRAIQRAVAAKREGRLRQMIVLNLISAVLEAALVLAFLHFRPWQVPAQKNPSESPHPAAIHSPGNQQTSPQPESSPYRQ